MDDLQRMAIERACERLVAQYCHFIDHGEAARVAELFTEDGVWTSPDATMAGREAVLAGFQRRQERAKRLSRHVCCNLLVEIQDEDHASGVVYLTLYRHDGEPGPRIAPLDGPAVVGEYRDAFTRTADGWRFARRDFVIAFMAEPT
jgi:ketosteroid isomerase-like protein